MQRIPEHTLPPDPFVRCAWLIVLVSMCSPAACATGGKVDEPRGDPARDDADAAPGSDGGRLGAGEQHAAPVEIGGCYSDEPRACFGELEVVAGTGTISEGGVNGWQPEFEGALASEVELSRPHRALADAGGRLYVADKDAHAVRRIDPDGTVVTVAGVNAPGDDGDEAGPGVELHLSAPNGLWVHPDGTVFILDLGNSKVRRLGTDGELTTLFEVPGLTIGRGLWVNEEETTAYVASGSELLEWTQGQLAVLAAGFVALGDLTVDPRGTLIVADRGAGKLFAVDEDGEVRLLAGGGTQGGAGIPATEVLLLGLRSAWPDEAGGYFLGLHEGSSVRYLGPNGLIHPLLDITSVREVRSVSLDTNGNLIVVDHDAGYVKRLLRK